MRPRHHVAGGDHPIPYHSTVLCYSLTSTARYAKSSEIASVDYVRVVRGCMGCEEQIRARAVMLCDVEAATNTARLLQTIVLRDTDVHSGVRVVPPRVLSTASDPATTRLGLYRMKNEYENDGRSRRGRGMINEICMRAIVLWTVFLAPGGAPFLR